MKVLKFGGCCLESRERLERVVDVVRLAEPPVVVVVSAVAGVTNRLHQILAGKPSDEAITGAIADLKSRHFLPFGGSPDAERDIDEVLLRLERTLFGMSYAGEVTPRIHDFVVSTGERLSAILVAAHLVRAGLAARAFNAEEAGMRCDGRHGSATLDLAATAEATERCLKPYVAAGGIPVVTGYYAITPDGHAATVGRSGSDYSATALASVLGARRVEIWKGVAGFMDTDPEMVAEARVIPELTYDEAAELAHFGARVIHPRAVEPARERDIPIHILHIDAPGSAGTRISASTARDKQSIKSVSFRRGLSILRVVARNGRSQGRSMAAIVGCLEDAGVGIASVTTSPASMALLIETRDERCALAALKDLPPGVAEGAQLSPGAAVICALGHELAESRTIAGRVFCAIAREKVAVDLISAGASEVAYHFTVPERDLEAAVRAIHREFFARRDVGRRLCVYATPSKAPARPACMEVVTSDRASVEVAQPSWPGLEGNAARTAP